MRAELEIQLLADLEKASCMIDTLRSVISQSPSLPCLDVLVMNVIPQYRIHPDNGVNLRTSWGKTPPLISGTYIS
jgi:hypothetical protein